MSYETEVTHSFKTFPPLPVANCNHTHSSKNNQKERNNKHPKETLFLKTLKGNFPPQAAKPAMHLSSEQIIVYQIYQSQSPICPIFFLHFKHWLFYKGEKNLKICD